MTGNSSRRLRVGRKVPGRTARPLAELARARELDRVDRVRIRAVAMSLAASAPSDWDDATELMRAAVKYLTGPVNELLHEHVARGFRQPAEDLDLTDDLRQQFGDYEGKLYQVGVMTFAKSFQHRFETLDDDRGERNAARSLQMPAIAAFVERWDPPAFWRSFESEMQDNRRWIARPPWTIAFFVVAILVSVGFLNVLPWEGQGRAALNVLTSTALASIVVAPCLLSFYIAYRLPRPAPFAERNLLLTRIVWFVSATWGTALLFFGALVGALVAVIVTAEELQRLQEDAGWSVKLLESQVLVPVAIIAAIVGFLAWNWLTFDLYRVRRSGRFVALLSRESTEELSRAMKDWIGLDLLSSLDAPPPRESRMTTKVAWARHLSSPIYPAVSYVAGFVFLGMLPWVWGTWMALV